MAKHYRYTVHGSKPARWVFTLTMDGRSYAVTPDLEAARRNVELVRGMLPAAWSDPEVRETLREVTFTEAHAAEIAQLVRLVIFNHEGLDLDVVEAK